MTNLKATKRALISSVLALLLCFSMLIGTTFAWFTDSAVSAGNTIKTGTLDVELFKWTDAQTAVGLTDLANEGKDTAVFSADVLWEPGHTQVAYLSIKNLGSLALKYRVAVIVTDLDPTDDVDMTEVMFYDIIEDAHFGSVRSWNKDEGKKVTLGTNATDAEDVALEPGVEHFFALSVHMDEEAGNKYQNKGLKFDIVVLAGQLVSEEDSFGPTYDADATYSNRVKVPDASNFPVAGLDVDIKDNGGEKIASMNFPAEALDPNAPYVGADIDVTANYKGGNIVINNGEEHVFLDIKPEGVKNGNTAPITIRYYMGEDKQYDPNSFRVYHNEEEIVCTYNPNTGYVTFAATSFSPFAILFDADSTYDPYDPNDSDAMPQAKVERTEEYENTDLEWGSYGQWSPTEGLDSQLEAAYTFSCTQTLAQAEANKYAKWYCDFVVKLDKPLGENQIFLGGNYGSFGWVGFHNGDLTLEANTEIPLLGSVTSNPWTYAEVVQNVGEFICGVGDVKNALSGATFTVSLRLTNPENEAEFYDVATINYTFN